MQMAASNQRPVRLILRILLRAIPISGRLPLAPCRELLCLPVCGSQLPAKPRKRVHNTGVRLQAFCSCADSRPAAASSSQPAMSGSTVGGGAEAKRQDLLALPTAAQLGFVVRGNEERWARWLQVVDRTILFPAHEGRRVRPFPPARSLDPS